MSRFSVLFLAIGLALGGASAASAHDGGHATVTPWQMASHWPDRIVATFEADPARSLAVSWRTSGDVAAARAEIALALPDARFDRQARSVAAATTRLDLQEIEREGVRIPVAHNADLPPVSFHSVRFDGLQPDTLYAYRVQGGEGRWSEWIQVRTAPASGRFRFLYLGDAQNGISSHWARAIRAAFQTAPDARFVLHAGDLVDHGTRDFEWAEWFRAGSFIHSMIPVVPVAGNHEYERIGLTPADQQRALSFMWRPMFRLPVEAALPASLHETVYQLRYTPDLHLFVLDSTSTELDVQARWLDAQLARSDARWRVVTMHHPVFSSGRDRDNERLRAALLPIFLKHKVDLVLQGHDHTYARGIIGADAMQPRRTGYREGDALAVMFVNSVSGPKQYTFKGDGWDSYAATGVKLERKGENSQFFQVIDIDGPNLTYSAHTTDGALYDRVTIGKSAAGVKTILRTDPRPVPERSFGNTLPYENVRD